MLMHFSVLLDEISSYDSQGLDSQLHLSDDAFRARMWRLRLSCENISERLKFKSVGDALYSVAAIMATLKRHAKCESKKLQVRKELLRVQHLGEDVAAGNDLDSNHVEVR